MTNDFDFPRADEAGDAGEPLDARTLAALRALYAPPADEQFWDATEQRVMARVLGRTSTEWWQVLSGWAHTGAVAAAVAIIVAAALLVTADPSAGEPDFAAFEAELEEPLAFSFDAPPRADARLNESPVQGVLPR